MLYAAKHAYEVKTKRDDFYSAVGPLPSTPMLGDLRMWAKANGDLDEKKASKLFPRLYSKFWSGE